MLKSTILDQLGAKHRTDKSSAAAAGHDYLRKYEFFLNPLRHKPFTLLELGVFKGGSLKMWAEFFPQAEIYGVDCEPSVAALSEGRIKIIIGDLGQTSFLEGLRDLKAHLIIDDASHVWSHQLLGLFVLYPALPSGGLYIVEDLHTSFQPLAPFFDGGLKHSPFEVLLKTAEYMTGNYRPAPIVPDKRLEPFKKHELFDEEIRYVADHTDSITFIERACILVKK